MAPYNRRAARIRRHNRIRKTLSGTAEQPRLSVFRSLNHVYAQIVDDVRGQTLVSASSLEEAIKSQADGKKKAAVAELVGELIGRRSLEKGIKKVAFDRGGFQYHGRVKALGDAARKQGLQF